MNHPFGVRRVSAILAILSVTVAKVCPGPITAGGDIVVSVATRSCGCSCMSLYPSALVAQFGVYVLDRSKVSRARLRVQFGKQRVIPLLLLQLMDTALFVIYIAEDNGVGRAGGGASG